MIRLALLTLLVSLVTYASIVDGAAYGEACTANPDTCDAASGTLVCADDGGALKCTCKPSFAFDGTHCVDSLGDCTIAGTPACPNGVANAECTGDGKCICSDGYSKGTGNTCEAALGDDCTSGDTVCTNGDSNSVCNVDKKCVCKANWADDGKGTCAQDCGDITAPANGAVDKSAGTTEDKTATYSCNAGFKIEGAATRQCTSGSWAGTAPTCSAILDSTCTAENAATVCTVTNSECKESKCACKDGFAATSGLCEIPDNSAGKIGLTANVILATLIVTFMQKHL